MAVTYQHRGDETRASKTRKWCGGRVEYGEVTKLDEEESSAVEPAEMRDEVDYEKGDITQRSEDGCSREPRTRRWGMH
jgi:hypothetical protein